MGVGGVWVPMIVPTTTQFKGIYSNVTCHIFGFYVFSASHTK